MAGHNGRSGKAPVVSNSVLAESSCFPGRVMRLGAPNRRPKPSTCPTGRARKVADIATGAPGDGWCRQSPSPRPGLLGQALEEGVLQPEKGREERNYTGPDATSTRRRGGIQAEIVPRHVPGCRSVEWRAVPRKPPAASTFFNGL